MISIIFCGDIKYCPYLSRYTERLRLKNIDYEVLFWNRGGFDISFKPNYHYYNRPSSESLNKIIKTVDFLRFRVWIRRRLNLSKPDGLILLSTLTGILLFDVARKYKNRYIFDVRDYSYEKISFFKRLETKIINNSCFTAISSKGFTSFLPEHDYVVAHNFNRLENNTHFSFARKVEPYQIVWNGTVRFFEYQKQFLDVFKNDPRYILVYHGAGTDLEKYKEYCKNNGINNVSFTGDYDNKNKYKLLKDAAFINNCYGGRNGDELKYAISNRFYDGLIYHIPQIVENTGFKAKETNRLNIGIPVEPTKDLPDKLFNYYKALDEEAFNRACDKALLEIIDEDDLFIGQIDDFISLFGGLDT